MEELFPSRVVKSFAARHNPMTHITPNRNAYRSNEQM
jgi:hypothetical protein